MCFTCNDVKRRSGSWLVPCPACPHLQAVLPAAVARAARASLLPALSPRAWPGHVLVWLFVAQKLLLGNQGWGRSTEGLQDIPQDLDSRRGGLHRGQGDLGITPNPGVLPAEGGSMCCWLAQQRNGGAGRGPSPFPAHPQLFLQPRNIVLPRPWVSKGTGMDQINKNSFLMTWKVAGSQGLVLGGSEDPREVPQPH